METAHPTIDVYRYVSSIFSAVVGPLDDEMFQFWWTYTDCLGAVHNKRRLQSLRRTFIKMFCYSLFSVSFHFLLCLWCVASLIRFCVLLLCNTQLSIHRHCERKNERAKRNRQIHFLGAFVSRFTISFHWIYAQIIQIMEIDGQWTQFALDKYIWRQCYYEAFLCCLQLNSNSIKSILMWTNTVSTSNKMNELIERNIPIDKYAQNYFRVKTVNKTGRSSPINLVSFLRDEM